MNNTVNLADYGLDFLIRFGGPGIKRGMVLKIYKAKIADLIGRPQAKSMVQDLKAAYLLPKNHNASDYDNPTLVLKFQPGSMWRTEMQYKRYQLKELINKRLESDFLKQIRIQ